MPFLIQEFHEEEAINARLSRDLSRIRADQQADPDNQQIAESINVIEEAVRDSQAKLGELREMINADEGRRVALRDLAVNGRSHELVGQGFESREQERRGAAFEESQRQMENLLKRGDLSSRAVDRLDRVIRDNDPAGGTAQYLAAVSQPDYARAFAKVMAHGESASTRMTPGELDAMSQVAKAEQFRTMVEGTPASGGYALPVAVDPTMNLVSSGAINPIRQLATVRTITTRELRLLATDGVTAAYAAEMTEATDNSPVLSQPDIITERAQCFVPVSIELTQDWMTLQSQLSDLFADAKDVLEATAFLTGAGHASNQPQGILTGLGTLSSQKVESAGTAAVATGDIYDLKAAIPFRFLPTAQFLASPAMIDRLYRLVPRASTTDPTLVSDDRSQVLGFPLNEYSAMTAAISTGSNVAIAGDIRRGYTIADRIGMNVEVIAHIFGQARNYPVGARGFYAFWRNSAAVIASTDSAPIVYLQTS